jgi:polysaccharide biosynthesis protein PslH
MDIVFLSRWYPFPANNGSKIRIYHLLRQLGRQHDVTLLTFANESDRVDAESLAMLQQSCREVRVFPYKEFRPSTARAAAGLFSSQPSYLTDTFSEDLAGALDERLADRRADVIVASELAMMPYPIHASAWPAILEDLELAVFQNAAAAPLSRASSVRARLTWWKLTRYLRQSLGSFGACTVVSEQERQLVSSVAPEAPSPHVVPNAVDTQSYLGEFSTPEPDSIVLSGALTYLPNYRGAQWFLRSVYPLIRERIPVPHFRITGGTRDVDLAGLPAAPGLELTGYVDDIRPVVAESMVSVVPLHSGAGTRLKILESMALGTPVVSTAKGAEGLEVVHGENILISDDPVEFAEYVVAVNRSPRLRAHLGTNGRELVRARYDWNVVGQVFGDIIENRLPRLW